MNLKIIALQFLCFTLGQAKFDQHQVDQSEPFKVLRIIPRTTDQLQFMKYLQINKKYSSQLDFWQSPKCLNCTVDVMLNPRISRNVIALLYKINIEYRVMIDDVQKQVNAEINEMKTSTRFSRRPKRSTPYFDFNSYGKYDEIVQYLQDLERTYPRLCKLLIIGNTTEARPIYTMQISNNLNDVNKQIVWIDAGIHAREWPTVHSALYFITELLENYGRDWKMTSYVDRLTFYIAPMLNPDGFVYSQGDSHPTVRLWRKNRSPKKCTWIAKFSRDFCCRGVDLNRNFDHHWADLSRSSDDPCDSNYAGESPFSEPESRAVRDFVLNHAYNMIIFISMHTYGQVWMHPYGHQKQQYPYDIEELKSVGEQATAAIREESGVEYKTGTVAEIMYEASGISMDWVKDKAQVKFTYLIELRPETGQKTNVYEWKGGFLLPANQLLPVAKETWKGVEAVVDHVLQ